MQLKVDQLSRFKTHFWLSQFLLGQITALYVQWHKLAALTLHWPWRQTLRVPESESHLTPSITEEERWRNAPGFVTSLHIRWHGLSDLKHNADIIIIITIIIVISLKHVTTIKEVLYPCYLTLWIYEMVHCYRRHTIDRGRLDCDRMTANTKD